MDFQGFRKALDYLAIEYFKNREDARNNIKPITKFFKTPAKFIAYREKAINEVRERHE